MTDDLNKRALDLVRRFHGEAYDLLRDLVKARQDQSALLIERDGELEAARTEVAAVAEISTARAAAEQEAARLRRALEELQQDEAKHVTYYFYRLWVRDTARQALASQPDNAVEPHDYCPDTMAMGDCSICGHTANSPLHIKPDNEAPAVAEAERCSKCGAEGADLECVRTTLHMACDSATCPVIAAARKEPS